MNTPLTQNVPHSVLRKITTHLLAASALTFIFSLLPSSHLVAHAASGEFPNPLGTKTTSISALLENLLQIIIIIGAIVVVIYLILAGFQYVTARGDETKISAAHKSLTWTVIGGAVVLGAQVISKAIQGTVTELK